MTTITIDCALCIAPVGSCDDCVVQAMIGAGERPTLTGDEQAALAVLSQARLVPPLRLVVAPDVAPEVKDTPIRRAVA